MEITYKNETPIIKLVKHVQKGNFRMILYRIAKNMLQRGHSTNLVQLTHIHAHKQIHIHTYPRTYLHLLTCNKSITVRG